MSKMCPVNTHAKFQKELPIDKEVAEVDIKQFDV